MLYKSDSGLFRNNAIQGSKLSLSYSVCVRKDIEAAGGEEMTPLGVISVNWKPISLLLQDGVLADSVAAQDEFIAVHGPLNLPNLTPIIFCGPPCQVLHAPFQAKLLKCPMMPKVGTPFCIKYQVSNKTAKSQSLVLNLVQEGDSRSPLLLSAGKLREVVQMAPYEDKEFTFTMMPMAAGKTLRPPLTVSSGQYWVINETAKSSRQLFVMP